MKLKFHYYDYEHLLEEDGEEKFQSTEKQENEWLWFWSSVEFAVRNKNKGHL